MNYIMRGIQALKESFLAGILVYLAILALLYLFKKRRNISWKCIFEAIFCVYCVTLLNLTGIFTLRYSLNGSFSYNLVPFIGSAIVPILLNFALFFPLGFLLPVIFRSCRSSWKKVAAICGLTSLAIEILQLFGGRYAEMEDFLINTLGGFQAALFIPGYMNGRRIVKKRLFPSFRYVWRLHFAFLGFTQSATMRSSCRTDWLPLKITLPKSMFILAAKSAALTLILTYTVPLQARSTIAAAIC